MHLILNLKEKKDTLNFFDWKRREAGAFQVAKHDSFSFFLFSLLLFSPFPQVGNGLLSIQIIHGSLWQPRLPPCRRVRSSIVAASITRITTILIIISSRTVRAVAMITSRSALITALATEARATQIPTITRRSNRKHPFSFNIKRRTRLRLSPSIPTTSSTVIHRAYRHRRVPLCNRYTVSKAHPSNPQWIFRTQTATRAQVPPTVRQTQLQQPRQRRLRENDQ